jgi:superfamily II DNA or RNA helicase
MKSQSLYIQQAGRGLRPYLSRRYCLVIDVADLAERHRLVQLAAADEYLLVMLERPRETEWMHRKPVAFEWAYGIAENRATYRSRGG